ncbi:MAG: hypothetical protein KME20_21115 [Kaiparowitsia implicata GSE-PSE-MK54-09C]|jgi:predicted PurR-regulated permease PerM|nr:hypothetical protein [Kaiparowitsia implicata GSE-PSE-MK54-09C]
MLISSSFVRLSTIAGFLASLPAAMLLMGGSAIAQVPNLPSDIPELPGESVDPLDEPSNDELRPLNQNNTLLSIEAGRRMITDAGTASSQQNYAEAATMLQQARQLFNQLTNFYQDLFNSFTAVDNRIADSLRRQAFETAQLRDEATYQLALVHRAQNQPELAVPLLIQIIRSQNPTRDLGQQAYRQLFELGFVESPYPRTQPDQSTSSTPAPNFSN